MSVAAFVGAADDARSVISWAGRFAAARNADLVIFYLPDSAHQSPIEAPVAIDEKTEDSTRAAIQKAVDGVVRTKRAQSGRIPRHAVSIRRIPDADPVQEALWRIRVESPDLFVTASFGSPSLSNGDKTISRRIAGKTPCDTIVLFGEKERFGKTGHILVGTSDGPHDKAAIDVAASAAAMGKGRATILSVEARVGEESVQVGERKLRSLLRELSLEESSSIRLKAVQGESLAQDLTDESRECDLLLVGENVSGALPKILKATPSMVGMIRRASRLGRGRIQDRVARVLPQINVTDYADLYEKLQSGSRWNSDFIVMLSLAAGIASLGLLQSSPAVVIGSMLLAPLMTPMIGMGLALNQGNSKLAYTCFRAISRGFLTALLISAAVGVITPGSELTPEIMARTEPNILDLLIAFFSGIAAAYAMARPSLAGSIAGVAIATALVPPTCSAGIALAYFHWTDAIGAFFLLVANVLAIILAAGATFRSMGLSSLARTATRTVWVRPAVAGLMTCVLIMIVPLISMFMSHLREGRNTPYALAVTGELREAILDHVAERPGVDVLFVGRSGIDRDTEPVDVGIILASRHPLPNSEAEELTQLIRDTMENPDLQVRVACVADRWEGTFSDGGVIGSRGP